MNITVRYAEEGDCKRLAEISAEAFSQPMSEGEFLRELGAGFSVTLVAEAGGETVGFINIWKMYDYAELNNIAVKEGFRHMGAGQALLDMGLRVCGDCKNMLLDVRKSNRNAIAFYEKNGFVVLCERKDFYQKPVEDAFTYQKIINA